jgi:hypothetical protein
MNIQNLIGKLDHMKVRVAALEEQAEVNRSVLYALIQKSQLEREEKEALISMLEHEAAEKPEQATEKVVYERSIQELLDESEGIAPST